MYEYRLKVNQSLLTLTSQRFIHDIEGNQDINDVFKDRKSIDKFEIAFFNLVKIATNVMRTELV